MEAINDGDGTIVEDNKEQVADADGEATVVQADAIVEPDGDADVQVASDSEAEVVITCKEEDLSFIESTNEIPLDSCESEELKVETHEFNETPVKNEDPQTAENTPLTEQPDSNKDEYVELDSIIQDSDKKPEAQKEEKRIAIKEERNIWLSNINPNTTASQLKLELSRYGKVLAAKIITNGEKYYGYALMEKPEHVKLCVEKLNGKKFHGYEVELGLEAPNKKRTEPKTKREEKKREEKPRSRKPRKRSRSQDPLTLKVEPRRRTRSKQRSRSGSRRRHDEELRLKKQRDLELQIEVEKRKLEAEKRQFQREKLEFIRMQRRAEEEKREREERERKKLQEVKRRRRSNTPSRKAWRRSKSASPHRKIIKLDKSPKLRRRKLSPTPPGVRSKSHSRRAKRSPTPKHDKIYRREERVPPPPPRLTHEDLRAKADPWKPKIEYFRSKDDFVLERDRIFHEDNYNDRSKRFHEDSFERKYNDLVKYPKEDEKYKDNKPRIYENTCKELPLKPVGVRSEVYQVVPRSSMPYCPNEPPRRFDNVAYPTQYNRGYVANSSNYQNVQQVTPWNRPVYSKDYLVPTVQNKAMHQDRYDDYDKRYQYFGSNRKY